MFGSKKTTVINTTTVDNNIYLDNDIQNDVQVTAEFNPSFANSVEVDTAPIAEAVKAAVAPIDRMAQSIMATMEENARQSATNSALQLLGITQAAAASRDQAAGLAAIGEGLSGKPGGPFGEIAGALEPLTKIAAGVLTLAAVYFLVAKGRLPDIEVSA